MGETDRVAMADAVAHGVYPAGGGKWRGRGRSPVARTAPIVWAHLDEDGNVLATFGSCVEAADALALLGPLAGVDAAAIFPEQA